MYSTVPAEAVFESEVKTMVQEQLKPSEQVTLEPFERDHPRVVGGYRMPKKQKVVAQGDGLCCFALLFRN